MQKYRAGEPLDFDQSYRKAADYCALQEHCLADVEIKLRLWNVDRKFHREILNRLVADGFINEKRYALEFVSGKWNINGWGKLKIAAALRQKKITGSTIRQALETINQEDYNKKLADLLAQKLAGSNGITEKQSAIRFALSRGFEPELVYKLMNETNIFEF
jgi:regulatory protein